MSESLDSTVFVSLSLSVENWARRESTRVLSWLLRLSSPSRRVLVTVKDCSMRLRLSSAEASCLEIVFNVSVSALSVFFDCFEMTITNRIMVIRPVARRMYCIL